MKSRRAGSLSAPPVEAMAGREARRSLRRAAPYRDKSMLALASPVITEIHAISLAQGQAARATNTERMMLW
jgi:hypothetical protein